MASLADGSTMLWQAVAGKGMLFQLLADAGTAPDAASALPVQC